MSLYLGPSGKLLVRDGKLAASEDCCCGNSSCPTDLPQCVELQLNISCGNCDDGCSASEDPAWNNTLHLGADCQYANGDLCQTLSICGYTFGFATLKLSSEYGGCWLLEIGCQPGSALIFRGVKDLGRSEENPEGTPLGAYSQVSVEGDPSAGGCATAANPGALVTVVEPESCPCKCASCTDCELCANSAPSTLQVSFSGGGDYPCDCVLQEDGYYVPHWTFSEASTEQKDGYPCVYYFHDIGLDYTCDAGQSIEDCEDCTDAETPRHFSVQVTFSSSGGGLQAQVDIIYLGYPDENGDFSLSQIYSSETVSISDCCSDFEADFYVSYDLTGGTSQNVCPFTMSFKPCE